jgi:hypothetical protein
MADERTGRQRGVATHIAKSISCPLLVPNGDQQHPENLVDHIQRSLQRPTDSFLFVSDALHRSVKPLGHRHPTRPRVVAFGHARKVKVRPWHGSAIQLECTCASIVALECSRRHEPGRLSFPEQVIRPAHRRVVGWDGAKPVNTREAISVLIALVELVGLCLNPNAKWCGWRGKGTTILLFTREATNTHVCSRPCAASMRGSRKRTMSLLYAYIILAPE